MRHAWQCVVRLWWIPAVVSLISSFFLFPSPGTGDVRLYEQLIDGFRTHDAGYLLTCARSICQGHTENYPVGYLGVLYVASRLPFTSGMSALLIEKSVVFVFYLLTLGVLSLGVGVGRRRALLFGITSVSMVVNAQGLGYLDVLIFPFFILAIFELVRGRVFMSGLLYSVSVLMKWTPLLLLPLLFVYLVRTKGLRGAGLFALGLCAPVILTAWVVSPTSWLEYLVASARAILGNPYFSAAPNIPWLVTPLMSEARIASYVDISRSITSVADFWLYTFTLLFFLFYAGVLMLVSQSRTVSSLVFLRAALALCVGYFFLAIGVHENHLMLGTVVALLLAVVHPKRAHSLLFRWVDSVSALSMVVFYGLQGSPLLPETLRGFQTSWIAAWVLSFGFVWYIGWYWKNSLESVHEKKI